MYTTVLLARRTASAAALGTECEGPAGPTFATRWTRVATLPHPMRAMRALSNREVQVRFRRACGARSSALRQDAREARPADGLPPGRKLRPGVIAAAVLAELTAIDRPLSVAELHAALERRLADNIVRDSLTSYLSVASRSADSPITRTGRARYQARA